MITNKFNFELTGFILKKSIFVYSLILDEAKSVERYQNSIG